MRNRFKSWALWLAIGALIVFCVKQFTGMDISESMDNFLNVLLPVLVGCGVVHNPTASKNIQCTLYSLPEKWEALFITIFSLSY